MIDGAGCEDGLWSWQMGAVQMSTRRCFKFPSSVRGTVLEERREVIDGSRLRNDKVSHSLYFTSFLGVVKAQKKLFH